MTTASDFLRDVLEPGIAFSQSVPGWNIPFDDRARLMLTAIPGTESGYTHRVQSGNGPAHSLFQFERMGGIHGVLHHPSTSVLAAEACRMSFVTPDETHVWGIFATAKGDNLSVAFARMNLWTDPHSLPTVGDEEGAWELYVRVWRPGAVSGGGARAADARDRWRDVYAQALAAVTGSPT